MTERTSPPWEALTCRAEERSEAIILVPCGEVDLGTAQMLRSSLKAILEDGHNVIVALDEIAYIDSTGIRALLELHRSFLNRGQRLALAEPASVVRKIIDLVALEETIPVYESLESALESFRASGGGGREKAQRGAVQ